MKSRTLIQKCIWSIALIIGLGVASYEVYTILYAYVNHQMSLSVSTLQGKQYWFLDRQIDKLFIYNSLSSLTIQYVSFKLLDSC